MYPGGELNFWSYHCLDIYPSVNILLIVAKHCTLPLPKASLVRSDHLIKELIFSYWCLAISFLFVCLLRDFFLRLRPNCI
jgi:hypothetical protein